MKGPISLKKIIPVVGVSGLYFVGSIHAFDITKGLNDEDLKKVVDDNNYIIVVGEKAKPIDVVAAIDLASALTSQKSSDIKSVDILMDIKEDANVLNKGEVPLWRDNDKINIGEGFKVSVVDINEGTLEGDKDYDYKVYLKFSEDTNSFKFTFDKPNNDKDPELLGDLSNSNSDHPVVELRIEFDKAVPFVDDNGDVNEDLVGEKLNINGKTFFISSETEDDKLVLYKTSEKIIINKGEKKTVNINGKEYTIEIQGFGEEGGDDKVILKVNNDIDDIKEGKSKKIGGIEIYADSIWTENDKKDGGAVLLVGGEKIVLKDGDEVKVGDDEDNVDDTKVVIQDETDNGKLDAVKEIDIKYWESDSDEDYIDENHPFDKDKNVLGVFTIKMKKTDMKTETYKIDRSDKKLEFTDIGKFAEIDNGIINKNDDGGVTHFVEGEDATTDDWIVIGTYKEIDGIKVADETTTALLKIDNIDLDDTQGKVEFKDVITGDDYKTSEGKFIDVGDKLTLNVKGEQYVVELVDKDNKKIRVYHEGWVDSDGKLKVVFAFPTIKTKDGMEMLPVVLDYNNSDGALKYTINKDELSSSPTFILPSNSISGSLDPSTGEIEIFTDNFDNNDKRVAGLLIREPRLEGQSEKERKVIFVSYEKDSEDKFHFKSVFDLSEDKSLKGVDYESNDNLEGFMDDYGTLFKVNTDSDDNDIEIEYPEEQVYGKFVVDLKNEDNEESESGSVLKVSIDKEGEKEINKFVKKVKVENVELEPKEIRLPIAYLDSEVNVDSIPDGELIISVGGPCVNDITKYFLEGTNYGSCETWPLQEGQYLVEYAKKGGKVALIIAGTKGEDTRKAVKDFINGEIRTQENIGVRSE
jgi:hypothetical protein